MAKAKLYNVREEEKKRLQRVTLWEFVFSMFVFAVILMMADAIFKGFYVENIFYAFIAAIVISLLDTWLRPFLTYLTLPVTIMSLGILYPLVNVIILKLAGFLMGSHFDVEGIIVPFIIALFISFVKTIANKLVIEPIIGRKMFK